MDFQSSRAIFYRLFRGHANHLVPVGDNWRKTKQSNFGKKYRITTMEVDWVSSHQISLCKCFPRKRQFNPGEISQSFKSYILNTIFLTCVGWPNNKRSMKKVVTSMWMQIWSWSKTQVSVSHCQVLYISWKLHLPSKTNTFSVWYIKCMLHSVFRRSL